MKQKNYLDIKSHSQQHNCTVPPNHNIQKQNLINAPQSEKFKGREVKLFYKNLHIIRKSLNAHIPFSYTFFPFLHLWPLNQLHFEEVRSHTLRNHSWQHSEVNSKSKKRMSRFIKIWIHLFIWFTAFLNCCPFSLSHTLSLSSSVSRVIYSHSFQKK